MSDLNELFKVLAEGKKDYQENNPVGKKVKEVKEHVKEDLSSLFAQLASLKEDLEQDLVNEEHKYEQLIIEETSELIAEETLDDTELLVEADPIPQTAISPDVDKYLRGKSFQQPDPDLVSKNIDDIRSKIKFLEQAMGRIAATGPGSGEVWFRWLDDVDRSTIDVPEADQEHVLRYNAATKKFFFGELTGDHREINSFTFDVDGPGIVKTPRMIYWNKNEDCLDIVQQDGTTLQIGLENYIQVRNSTGSVLTNGTVVRFSGAYSNGDYVPEVVPHIADGTIPPLYTVGVITVDIPNNTNGRCTVLGKVRDINTTGSDVSEIWNEGDILYVHPTIPGKMTKNKPTAPNIVVSVAAVLKKDSTTGILLVRPTIFPRLFYGTFSDKTNQSHTLINTPKAITFNTTEIANGFSRGVDTSHIIAANSGLYNFKFSIQLVSSNSAAKEVWIWFRKNGIDIVDSASRKTIVGNLVYDVAAWDITVSMLPNDYFQIMWAVSDTAVTVVAPPATTFAPAIPSVLLTVSEIAL